MCSSSGYDIEKLAREVFDASKLDVAVVKPLLAPNVVWEDYTTRLVSGAADVEAMLADKPAAARPYAVDRVANGKTSGGFTYHREDASGTRGLRGTVYVELNANGQIAYVREMSEPLFKPGDAMIKFLQAVAKPKGDETPAAYEKRTPVGCPDAVRYIWKESNGDMEEALKLMSDGVRYEDFNYPEPFLGKAQVKPFLDEFTLDLGIIFVALPLDVLIPQPFGYDIGMRADYIAFIGEAIQLPPEILER